jgi:hypothetical protein
MPRHQLSLMTHFLHHPKDFLTTSSFWRIIGFARLIDPLLEVFSRHHDSRCKNLTSTSRFFTGAMRPVSIRPTVEGEMATLMALRILGV